MTRVAGEPIPRDLRHVAGVRTRGSDLIRWAVWTGDLPDRSRPTVRLSDTGETGVLVIAPGMAVGEFPIASLPQASIVDLNHLEIAEDGEFPVESAWGRIGARTRGRVPSGDSGESAESIRYLQLKAGVPALGSRIDIAHGSGVVIASNAFQGTLSVRLDATSDVIEIRLPERDGDRL